MTFLRTALMLLVLCAAALTLGLLAGLVFAEVLIESVFRELLG